MLLCTNKSNPLLSKRNREKLTEQKIPQKMHLRIKSYPIKSVRVLIVILLNEKQIQENKFILP